MMIETERLYIKKSTLDKAAELAALITEKIAFWTSPVPWPYSLDDAKWWLENMPEGSMNLFLKSTDVMIGAFHLAQQDGESIGFYINEQWEGHGYITEAGKAAIHHIFMVQNLTHIVSSAHIDNPASIRVHEKLGFTKTGEEKRFWPNKNTDIPVVTFRLNKSAWQT
ncbi:MAG: GNAT family N-acetyltransferase [Alphaproteobacteria bacterium]